MPNTNKCEDCTYYDGKYCLYFLAFDAKPFIPKRTDGYCENFEEYVEEEE